MKYKWLNQMMFDLQDATGLEHDMTRLKVQAGSNGGVFEAISILRYLGMKPKGIFHIVETE